MENTKTRKLSPKEIEGATKKLHKLLTCAARWDKFVRETKYRGRSSNPFGKKKISTRNGKEIIRGVPRRKNKKGGTRTAEVRWTGKKGR
jgi:hypothetical protein